MTTTAVALGFGNRIRPDEVTPEVRQRLIRLETIGESVRIGLLLVISTFISLGLSLAYRWKGRPWKMELQVILPILTVALCLAIAIHLVFAARRRFIRTAPVTGAIIVREKMTESYSDDGATQIPRLFVRYLPALGTHFDPGLLHHGGPDRTTWVKLSGLSSEFEDHLRPHDLVTVLYDPENPKHVQVLECERKEELAIPAAA